MNKNLTKLHLEAANYAKKKYPGDVVEWAMCMSEKFAELIVRECLDIASEVRGEPKNDTHFVIGYDLACEKMVDAFKEHFGIES